MNAQMEDGWLPTMNLRWQYHWGDRKNVLMQEWQRMILIDHVCHGFEHEWREIPQGEDL